MEFNKGFIIVLALFVLLILTLMEFSKNAVWGMGAALALAVVFLILHGTVLHDKHILIRLISWLLFLGGMFALIKLSPPPERRLPAVSAGAPETTGAVTVSEGLLTGVYTEDGAVEVYAGVPYAKPPVGELRWKAPEAPEKWEGVRVCDRFAPMSMQQRGSRLVDTLSHIFVYRDYKPSLADNYVEAMSEDSLYLNIWKPAGDISGAPVLFYIHGGSLTTGQTSFHDHSGEEYARRGVVFVSAAYRLNVFGFYANSLLADEDPNGTTGNYGLLDLLRALEWVHENIAAFGGDPEKVTIAGESAGASCVGALCVSPLAKGLFRYAIAESSGITAKKPYHTFRSYTSALETGNEIMQEFSASSIDDLRALPAEKLVNTRHQNSAMTVDGWAITEQPYLTYARGANNEQALLSGYNMHEADVFALARKVTAEDYEQALMPVLGKYAKQAARLFPPRERDKRYSFFFDAGGDAKGSFNEVYSAAWFDYSHYCWSSLLADEGRSAYLYFFNKDNGGIGSIHSGEIAYAYGNLDGRSKNYDGSDLALSETMVSYWLNFIRTGDPNDEGLPVWERFNDAPELVLELSNEVSMQPERYLELYKLIDLYQDAAEAQPSGAGE
ncbi:MAG: carboxylesterase family protein [Clostridia bacterium]|nr:carboxylesterase family protein [Clostridia bacterium]